MTKIQEYNTTIRQKSRIQEDKNIIDQQDNRAIIHKVKMSLKKKDNNT